jgi:hypothetical protein
MEPIPESWLCVSLLLYGDGVLARDAANDSAASTSRIGTKLFYLLKGCPGRAGLQDDLF